MVDLFQVVVAVIIFQKRDLCTTFYKEQQEKPTEFMVGFREKISCGRGCAKCVSLFPTATLQYRFFLTLEISSCFNVLCKFRPMKVKVATKRESVDERNSFSSKWISSFLCFCFWFVVFKIKLFPLIPLSNLVCPTCSATVSLLYRPPFNLPWTFCYWKIKNNFKTTTI